MPIHSLTPLKRFWNTPTGEVRPTLSISTGGRFLLFFSFFFIIVKLNDPLDEILHIFRIGFAVLCAWLVGGLAEALFFKATGRRLVASFGQMFIGFLVLYGLAVGVVYLLEEILAGAPGEGWIWRYYWRHLPFALLVIGLYLHGAYRRAVVDRLAARLNSLLEGAVADAEAMSSTRQGHAPLDVEVNGIVTRLRPEAILAISVSGHYLDVRHLKDGAAACLTVRKPLAEILAELPGDSFAKIHRSHIVNLGYVRRLKKVKRQYHIQLYHLDAALPISRSHLPQVLARIGQAPSRPHPLCS